jgi:hypothetical protein
MCTLVTNSFWAAATAYKETKTSVTQEKIVKKLFRVTVLTIVTAGILSAAALPKNPASGTKTNASPIPCCDPWSGADCR